MEQLIDGKDVFVSLPTGSGKSLCYCVLPRVYDILQRSDSSKNRSIAIIVSPLISLMLDQVRHMTERNGSAVYVGDCKSEADVCDGLYQLVFLGC